MSATLGLGEVSNISIGIGIGISAPDTKQKRQAARTTDSEQRTANSERSVSDSELPSLHRPTCYICIHSHCSSTALPRHASPKHFWKGAIGRPTWNAWNGLNACRPGSTCAIWNRMPQTAILTLQYPQHGPLQLPISLCPIYIPMKRDVSLRRIAMRREASHQRNYKLHKKKGSLRDLPYTEHIALRRHSCASTRSVSHLAYERHSNCNYGVSCFQQAQPARTPAAVPRLSIRSRSSLQKYISRSMSAAPNSGYYCICSTYMPLAIPYHLSLPVDTTSLCRTSATITTWPAQMTLQPSLGINNDYSGLGVHSIPAHAARSSRMTKLRARLLCSDSARSVPPRGFSQRQTSTYRQYRQHFDNIIAKRNFTYQSMAQATEVFCSSTAYPWHRSP
ncbi:uncharacterized protein MYCFIDRAFT_176366 [Pseudocercospora fijiensis CIRAD86]|uniref:Uncharacterized protein n=1 Tax=Pseudocercospora fijiensis (strain CIRAD86) TaxID=383855 RepID=M3AU55_PSEFD|nr:uncharacterized protein MYCFIDRAFT_176366 [Pseudocercospora fijiensis CIRAD86]EME81022.1 hypothetical protein MYCFIDRAFT_176366 [Pseudocercospora fijiensis CIRAD86]